MRPSQSRNKRDERCKGASLDEPPQFELRRMPSYGNDWVFNLFQVISVHFADELE
jgi:hypothetical protein